MSISTNIPGAAAQPHPDYGQRIATLEHRVELLEASQPMPRNRDWPPPPELIEQIKEITRTLFGSDVETEIDCDPSEPNDPWMNFVVSSDFEPGQYRQLVHQWHEAVYHLRVGDATRFRVLVIPS